MNSLVALALVGCGSVVGDTSALDTAIDSGTSADVDSSVDPDSDTLHPPQPVVLADGVWVRGESVEFDAAALFTSSGDITAQGAPLGIRVDSAGLVSGTPLSNRPSEPIVLTRGDQTVSVSIGVSRAADVPPPVAYTFNVDILRLGPSTTQSVVSTLAQLDAAIVAAVDHPSNTGATSADPVIHTISYPGPDQDTHLFRFDMTPPTSELANVIVRIDGNGASLRHLRYGYRWANLVFYDWVFLGWAGGASSRPGAIHSANAQLAFVDCKVGPWFGDDRITGLSNDNPFALPLVEAAAGARLSFERTHLAGWVRGGVFGCDEDDTVTQVVDSLVSHGGEDTVRMYGGGPGDVASLWWVGNTVSNHVSGNARWHTDFIQTGAQFSGPGFTKHIGVFKSVVIVDSVRYGGTGIRQQQEGNEGLESVVVDDVIVLHTGYNGLVLNTVDVQVSRYLEGPAPGFGASDSWIDFNSTGGGIAPASASIGDLVIGHLTFERGWQGHDLSVGGQLTSYTPNNLASVRSAFPQLPGGVQAHSQHGGAALDQDRSYFVPTTPTYLLHPDSLRGAVSDAFVPAQGWGNHSPTDPQSYDAGWGTAPSTPGPSVSDVGLNAQSIQLSTTQAGGVIWWQLTSDSLTSSGPTPAQMRGGAMANGQFSGPTDGGTSTSPVLDWGFAAVDAPGEVVVPLRMTAPVGSVAYVMHETQAGGVSSVMRVAR